MYSKTPVPIPQREHGISVKVIKGHQYIYYDTYKYDKTKKRTVSISRSIGKAISDKPGMMLPNDNYTLLFDEDIPQASVAEEGDSNVDDIDYQGAGDDNDDTEEYEDRESRAGVFVHEQWVTKVGNFIVISKILETLGLKEILRKILGIYYALFLDFVSYMIISEDNTGCHYPMYGREHALFTKDMRVVSDSKISRFFRDISENASYEFLDIWNETQDHQSKIYIAYDSTNKPSQAGEVDMADYGNAKDEPSKSNINYAIAFDLTNKKPLLYEYYPGCINDVNQLQNTIEMLNNYGYNNLGFILDRGYFSLKNIRFMDKHNYSFIIMVKGMRTLVHDLVSNLKGSFEDKFSNYISKYGVAGITCKIPLCDEDEKYRCFHIYYNPHKAAHEKTRLLDKLNESECSFKNKIGKKLTPTKDALNYFTFTYSSDGNLESYACKNDIIDDEIGHAGYFVIITSEDMSAKDAISLYKSRDVNEKLFRTDKSYLGNCSERVHFSDPTRVEMFISFVALIIRNEMHTLLQKRAEAIRKRPGHLTVEGAIDELENVKIVRTAKYKYRLQSELTRKQKEIFSAFNITPAMVKREAMAIGEAIKQAAEKDPRSTVYKE